jgi:dihydropteroate synthase
MLEAGFDLVNDISAGTQDVEMCATCVVYNAPCILMHMQGTPQTMQERPAYYDVVAEVRAHLIARINAAHAAGLYDLVLDPGFGFGKTLGHNYALFKALGQFTTLGPPVLIGISRKSMVSRLFGTSHTQVGPATAALHMGALQAGVRILRVHAVAEARQVLQLYTYLNEGTI